jgi:tetratricopeptide (TPR) repeat protein
MLTSTIIKIYRDNKSLLLILLAGIILRLWQINWGLPELWEEATPLTISWKFWNWGKPGFDFNPHFFNYPALTFYIQFIAQGIYYIAGNLIGIYPNLASFGTSPVPLIITARFIDVLFDFLTIIVVYKIGQEVWNKRVGIIAALLLAVNPLHVTLAHLIQVDTILTFFCALSVLYIMRIYNSGERKWYLLAGLFIALAASSKYTGAFLLFPFFGAHLLRSGSFREAVQTMNHPPLYTSIILGILVFFCLNPFIILSSGEFQQDFGYEQAHISAGHLGIDTSKSTFDFYIFHIFPSALGIAGLVISIGAMIFNIIRKNKKEIVVALFPIIYLIIVSTWEMRADRYVLPIIPLFILFTTAGVFLVGDYILNKLRQTDKPERIKSRQWIMYSAVVFLIILQPINNSLIYLQRLGLPDTRAITKKWIQENLPRRSFIVSGPYGVEFPDSSYRIIRIPFIAVQSELAAPFYDTRWYADADLLIASSFDHDRFAMDPARYGEFLMYYNSLSTRWKKVFEAIPSKGQGGPSIWLFTPPDSLRRKEFEVSLFERLDGNPESTKISNFLKEINSLALDKKQFEKSEQILKMLLMNEGNNLPVRNQLARVLYEQGKYTAALVQLQQSVQIDKNQPEVFALAGNALLKSGHLGEAEAALSTALNLNNRLESAYMGLIELYTGRKENLKLLDVLKRYYSTLYLQSEDAKKIKKSIDSLQIMLKK